MRSRNILPRHKIYKFGINCNSFSWCRHDKNCKLNINYRNVFLYIKRINSGQFTVETVGVYLPGLVMRDTYTNSIINDNDVIILKHKMNRSDDICS